MWKRQTRRRPLNEVHDPKEPALRLRCIPINGSLPDETDRGLYDNRPPRAKAEPIGEALERAYPQIIGEPCRVESVILPSGLHRVKYQQYNAIPDVEALKEICRVNDGRYVFSAAWMGKNRVGQAILAWKEYQV